MSPAASGFTRCRARRSCMTSDPRCGGVTPRPRRFCRLPVTNQVRVTANVSSFGRDGGPGRSIPRESQDLRGTGARAQTPDPRPQTADPRPQTPDRRPQTPDPRPQTADPRPQNPRPQTPDRRPQTPDRRPQSIDPEQLRINSALSGRPLEKITSCRFPAAKGFFGFNFRMHDARRIAPGQRNRHVTRIIQHFIECKWPTLAYVD